MASCLLHMLAVVAPALGTSEIGLGVASSLARSAAQPRALDVRFEEPEAPAAVRAAPPAHGRTASRGVDVLPFPAHLYRFRTADELTKRPRPRTKPALNVPAPIFTPGKVVLRVWIDAAGSVLGVDVEKSTVPEALAASAVSVFRQISFTPAEADGARVAALIRIEVTYADGVTFNVSR